VEKFVVQTICYALFGLLSYKHKRRFSRWAFITNVWLEVRRLLKYGNQLAVPIIYMLLWPGSEYNYNRHALQLSKVIN